MTAHTARLEVDGGNGGRPEPHHERVGKLLQPRPSQPGLQRGQPPHGKAAAPVARSKAQDAGGEIRAILRREAVRRLQPPASHAANRGLSEREGMISSESRMREIRTSGLMSGGLETGPRETGLRPGGESNGTATVPYSHRVSPRLYRGEVGRRATCPMRYEKTGCVHIARVRTH